MPRNEPDRERLEELDEHIEQTRKDLAELEGRDEKPLFIQKGELSDDSVDDTALP